MKKKLGELMDISEIYYEKNVLRAIFATDGIKFFVKDKERRFVDANQAFLDFYGFESAADIRGRTDEDMGWHVDPVPFKKDELRVLEKGDKIEGAEGTCIIRGEIRNIRAFKMPIYDDDDNIIGLVGYFYDYTDEIREKEHTEKKMRRDKLTGLLNKDGLVEQLAVYEAGYNLRGINFCCIYLNIDNFRDIFEEYGQDYSDELLINIAECFSLTLSTGGVMARMYSDNFVILHQLTRENQVDIILSRLRLALNKVIVMTDRQLKPGISVGTSLISEAEDGEHMINLAEARMIEDKNRRKDNGIHAGMS